jgi:hypothetical protein
MSTPDLKSLLRDNLVSFARYRKGYLYYTIGERVPVWSTDPEVKEPLHYLIGQLWEFPVPIEDVGDATFNATEKALLFMRYIRKAQEEGSFVRIKT